MLDAAPSEFRDEREPELWGNAPEAADEFDAWAGNYAALAERQEVRSVADASEAASSLRFSHRASHVSEDASMTSSHSLTVRRLKSFHKIKLAAAVAAMRQEETVEEEDEVESPDHKKAAALWTKARMHAVTVTKAGKVQPWQPKMIKFLESKEWETLVVTLVLINAVCIAVDTDLPEETWPRVNLLMSFIQSLIGLFFCVEGVLKLKSYGWRRISQSRAKKYELTIAVIGALDLLLVDLSNNRAGFNFLPCLRAARLTFVLKTGELGVITRCFFPAFGTLIHVTIFLFLIIFMYSVPLVRLVGTNPLWADEPEMEELFGTLPRATFALLQMMINPDTALMQKLVERQGWTAPFFLTYVLMTTYSVLSIIVGAMSENYKTFADAERERQGQAERDRQTKIRHRLLIQLQADDAQDPEHQGSLTRVQFMSRLEGWGFQRALQDLKIDNDTAMELINLLEMDGRVYYEEFVDALGSLHADVKPTDLLVLRARLIDEIRGVEQQCLPIARLEEQIAQSFSSMEDRLTQRIDNGLAELRKGLLGLQQKGA